MNGTYGGVSYAGLTRLERQRSQLAEAIAHIVIHSGEAPYAGGSLLAEYRDVCDRIAGIHLTYTELTCRICERFGGNRYGDDGGHGHS